MALSLAERLKGSGRSSWWRGGDSGSGKTTLSRGIRRLLGEEVVSTFSMDDYHSLDREERRVRGMTPLNPEANRLDLLAAHLRSLRRGETIPKPVYAHSEGIFPEPDPFRSAPVLIIEGSIPFTPKSSGGRSTLGSSSTRAGRSRGGGRFGETAAIGVTSGRR